MSCGLHSCTDPQQYRLCVNADVHNVQPPPLCSQITPYVVVVVFLLHFAVLRCSSRSSRLCLVLNAKTVLFLDPFSFLDPSIERNTDKIYTLNKGTHDEILFWPLAIGHLEWILVGIVVRIFIWNVANNMVSIIDVKIILILAFI